MQKKYWMLVALLVLALSVAAGIGVAEANRASRMEARLHEVYDGALLSALRQMEDMQLMLSKALLSADTGESMQYLSQASGGAAQVQRSLSLLPLSHTATQNAVKFANQLSDYAETLIAAQTLSEQDVAQLDGLISACQAATQALFAARDTLSAQAAAGESGFYPAQDAAQPSFDSAVAYPTLIYDGPFSDARTDGPAKGLGPREISREEAQQLARDFVGADQVMGVSAGADSGGPIPCFGVTLQLQDVTLEAAVTKQGGKILWLSPNSGEFPTEKSIEDCRESALAFLSARGYENMRATYFQVYDGVAVISFAATQGDTLLYPDLIKVQLRMDTAQVVGLEARNYLQNHTPRGVLLPVLTLEEAQGAVSNRLTIDTAQLCLIPESGGEVLCYEFKGSYNGATYLCYINAETGRQQELLKVIETETGLETA